MIIHTKSYPRAALIGNPSDGYFGKTIAFVFSDFCAEVRLYESPELEIIPQERDRSSYADIESLYRDVQLHGYYGGIRLLKATIKKFLEHARKHRIVLDNRNFTIRYRSNIPHRLGLAGSSAIITACMKALMEFYHIRIPKPQLANLILSVETEELDIGAGLQDRVAQVYEEPVFMDFEEGFFRRHGYGQYETFDPGLLRNLYIAYRTDLSEGSEVIHNDLRKRFNQGDRKVIEAMSRFAEITEEARTCLRDNNYNQLAHLLDANFALRKSIMQIDRRNMAMVELARELGSPAKFTGSGGAIIGIYENEEMYQRLQEKLNGHHIEILKPAIVGAKGA